MPDQTTNLPIIFSDEAINRIAFDIASRNYLTLNEPKGFTENDEALDAFRIAMIDEYPSDNIDGDTEEGSDSMYNHLEAVSAIVGWNVGVWSKFEDDSLDDLMTNIYDLKNDIVRGIKRLQSAQASEPDSTDENAPR